MLMNTRLLFVWIVLVIASPLTAQEGVVGPARPSGAPLHAGARVLAQKVVRERDGGTTTFQRIEAPTSLPMVEAPPAVMLSPQEQEKQRRQANKESVMLSLSATLHAGGIAQVRCGLGVGEVVRAVSREDFRLLLGEGQIETETQVLSLIVAAGADENPAAPELATAALGLPPEGGFVLLDTVDANDGQKRRAIALLRVLHEYVSANRVVLQQKQARRQAEAAAAELARQNAPPPPPKHTVFQFWKLPRPAAGTVQAPTSTPAVPSTREGGAARP